MNKSGAWMGETKVAPKKHEIRRKTPVFQEFQIRFGQILSAQKLYLI